MRRSVQMLVLGALVAMTAAPIFARGSQVSSPLALAKLADNLQPGDWVWAPTIAPLGPLLIYVELDRQLGTVYRNGERIGVTTILSSKAGQTTPAGVFTLLEKQDIDHRSSTYNKAQMPFEQRLSWDGVAMHAANRPGRPAGHGSVRLPLEFSRLLFETPTTGGTVVIANRPSHPRKRPLAGVLAPLKAGAAAVAGQPLGQGDAFRWTPEESPSGPVSIIVSTGDQMVVVLRGGTEIGRARASIGQQASEAQVLTLARDKNGRDEWIQVGVNNSKLNIAAPVSTRGVEQMRLPGPFVRRMRQVMKPGTTVLITRESVSAQTTGTRTTIFFSQ